MDETTGTDDNSILFMWMCMGLELSSSAGEKCTDFRSLAWPPRWGLRPVKSSGRHDHRLRHRHQRPLPCMLSLSNVLLRENCLQQFKNRFIPILLNGSLLCLFGEFGARVWIKCDLFSLPFTNYGNKTCWYAIKYLRYVCLFGWIRRLLAVGWWLVCCFVLFSAMLVSRFLSLPPHFLAIC